MTRGAHSRLFRKAARWRAYTGEYHRQHVGWGRAPRESAQRNATTQSRALAIAQPVESSPKLLKSPRIHKGFDLEVLKNDKTNDRPQRR